MTDGANILTDNLHQVRQRHHSPRDYKIIAVVFILSTQMDGFTILQTNCLNDSLGHTDLLASTINEPKGHLREKDGQRYAWEAAASAKIEDTRSWTETDHPGNSHRMKDMMEIEIVNILTGYDINLFIPFAV